MYRDYLKTDIGFWIVHGDDEGINKIEHTTEKPVGDINRNLYTDSLIKQLRGYFDGLEIVFEIPLNMENYTEFQQSVWQELLKIPHGKTISYLELAFRIGNPKAIRAAASANGKNPFPVVVPCHRVIGSNGDLTGYSLGLNIKEYLLELENVISSKQMSLF